MLLVFLFWQAGERGDIIGMLTRILDSSSALLSPKTTDSLEDTRYSQLLVGCSNRPVVKHAGRLSFLRNSTRLTTVRIMRSV